MAGVRQAATLPRRSREVERERRRPGRAIGDEQVPEPGELGAHPPALGVEEGALPRHREREIRSQVSENPEHHRFERPIHENALAAAYYRDADGKLAFIHTEVPAEFTGQGIATELARGALDIVRVSGRKAILICPFMTSFYAKHPEYSDVVVG